MTKKLKNPPKQNNALAKVRKKIFVQALIATQTIIITIALIFGMSAAWYTNVLQTSGLQFEAAAWGFSGEVLVTQEPIEASPGENGMIGLYVTNTGDEMIDVAVNVSKEQMDVQMRQRLFFYIDTVTSRNDEVMERVYINTRDSYTYSVMSHSELILSQERSNDLLLKWQWVYDMLGYYFVGSVKEVVDAENNTAIVASVEDYLRPVEYDLDNATFADGLLATVGEMTKEEFLAQLSATDGYANDIQPTDKPGYYQIAVDENGYGIWVYLCNWAEIQQATTYDTQLGKAAAEALLNGTQRDSYKARLTVVGQVSFTETTQVTTVEQLVTNLNKGGMLQLQQDLVLTEPIAVSSSAKTVLDLNGHTITGAAGNPVLHLSDGSKLTLMNGEIVAQDANNDVISVSNSTLTLSNVSISGDGDDAINVSDQDGQADSCIRLFDSQIDTAGCAVYLRGNGSLSTAKTQVMISNCVLNSGYIAVMGNGTASYWGTDIQIYQSQLTARYAAVYQPQGDSVTRVTESTLSGHNGVVLKGGELEVVDSEIYGTGTYAEPKVEGSGYTDTGDAVYVDCSYSVPIRVSISGSSIVESTNSLAVQVFEPYGNYAAVTLTGGTYSSDISAYVPDGYVFADGVVSEAPEEEVTEDAQA